MLSRPSLVPRVPSRPGHAPRIVTRQRAELALRDAAMLLEALLALVGARGCVRLCFRRVAGWALGCGPAHIPGPQPHLQLRLSRAVERAAALLPGASLCLPRAMAAKWMLERRGFASTIHLGVGRDPGRRLHAHAWLEAGGGLITGASGVDSVTRLPR